MFKSVIFPFLNKELLSTGKVAYDFALIKQEVHPWITIKSKIISF